MAPVKLDSPVKVFVVSVVLEPPGQTAIKVFFYSSSQRVIKLWNFKVFRLNFKEKYVFSFLHYMVTHVHAVISVDTGCRN